MMNIAHKSYRQILLYLYSALSFLELDRLLPAVNLSFFSPYIIPPSLNPSPPRFYLHLTNGFHVRAYTSIIVSNESKIDLHTHLTSALPEGHNLWLDACHHATLMVCSCNVYIPWVLYSCERGTPADSSSMPGQVCGWEISRLLPAFKVNLKCTRENKIDRERSNESLENALK